jgi:cell division protein ZapA
MAEVTLAIGGHSYQVACRDGEEDHLLRLGGLVDAKVGEAQAIVGATSEVRQLLFSALLFADEALELRKQPAITNAPASPREDPSLDQLAARLEAMAERLEKSAQTA